VKFLLDHDVPEDLRYLLEQLGHAVTLVREVLPSDAADEAVLRFAHENGNLMLTCNRDDFSGTGNESTPSRDHHRDPPVNASGGKGCAVSTFDTDRGDRTPEQHQLRLNQH
jgi:hypothetical protein